MIYSIKDKPPIKELLLYAFQLLLACFTATALIASICGVNISAALIGPGVATLIYILITKGNSPMYLSNSGAYVAPVLTALALGGYTAVAIGGITTAIVYCVFGIIFSYIPVEKIYNIFPKALIGAITAVIGLNLMTFIPTYVQINGNTSQWGIVIAMITMLATALISHYAKGIIRILPFLLGTLIGYIAAAAITLLGWCQIVDFNIFSNVRLFVLPDFAFFHFSSIQFSTILTVVVMYVAYTISAMMECLSDTRALGDIIGVDLYRNPGLSKVFIGEGIANIFGTAIGGLGICSYGEGVACVGFSKVASVFTTATAAIMMIILGFLGPIQAFIASIPNCVFGGSAMILYSFIAISGIKQLKDVDLNNQKNVLLVGIPISLGVCGIAIGGSTLSFSGTALALIVGVILNIILKEKN